MLRQNTCLVQLTVMVLVISMVGSLRAQEAKTSPPATLGDAAKVLDLSTFPLMPGGKLAGPPRLANLGYSAKGSVREAYAFQQKTLGAQGWKILPGEYVTDMACSGMFGKDGYTVSVLTSPDTGGMVRIYVKNHGNVDPGKLPVPSDAKPQYAFPTSAAYVTETPVKETAEALKKLLAEQGWEPYGSAGDQLFFKKNAIRISARPLVAPAQGNKTMIQLSSELLSADLPAPLSCSRPPMPT